MILNNHFLAFGGGVQSTAIVMMLLKQPHLLKIRPRYILFADTGAEPSYVYSHVENVAKMIQDADMGYEFKYIRSVRGFIEDSDQNLTYPPFFIKNVTNNKKDGILRRQCTGHFKITPIQNYMRSLMRLAYREKIKDREKAVLWLGISTDERSRAKGSVEKWLELYYPLLDLEISRKACYLLNTMNFDYTVEKSACYFCPYMKNKEWVRKRDLYPEDYEKAIAVDERIRKMTTMDSLMGIPYVHSSCVPLREAVENLEDDRDNLGFMQECCGVCEM